MMSKKYQLIVATIFIIMLNFLFYKNYYTEFFDYKIYDIFSNIEKNIKTEKNNSSVVVVDVDEESLRLIGQWPWSRLILTQFLKNLKQAHPSSIGMDILFSEYDRTSPNMIVDFYKNILSKDVQIVGLEENLKNNDKIFANQISSSKVILPIFVSPKFDKDCKINIRNLIIQDDSSVKLFSNKAICNIKILQDSAYNTGFINANSDDDGIFRRVSLFMRYKNKIVPSFALANLSTVDNINLNGQTLSILDNKLKINSDSSALLRFYSQSHFNTISAYDILTNNFDKKELNGKFVLVGSTAIGLKDFYKLADNRNIAGVYIHATLIDNILNNKLIVQKDTFKFIYILLSILLSFLTIYLLLKDNANGLVFILVIVCILTILNYYYFTQNIYLHFGYFIIPYLCLFFLLSTFFIFKYFKDKRDFEKTLLHAHSSAIDSMVIVIENRDHETGEHIKRIKEYVKLICLYLYKNKIYQDIVNKNFIDLIYIASPLHDIGKIGIPDNILKKTGRLSIEEFDTMKIHPNIGKDIIKKALEEHKNNDLLKMAYNIAYYHHEKWDGSGYPTGLKEDNIPLEARIMALADVYDALTSKRYYKEAFDYDISENIILKGEGTHFEPILIEAFVNLKDEFKQIAKKYKDQ